jgi:hypothetical protein
MVKGWQLEFQDSTSLRGDSLAAILQKVGEAAGVSEIWLKGIEGSGPRLTRLLSLSHRSERIRIDEVMEVLHGISQLDWGDFVFISPNQALPDLNLRDLVLSAIVLVRAVDSNYVYIYGRDEALFEALQRIFPRARVKKGGIETLDFPE